VLVCLSNSSGPKSVCRLLQRWKFYTVIMAISLLLLLICFYGVALTVVIVVSRLVDLTHPCTSTMCRRRRTGCNILYYKIAQFVVNAVGVYTSGHTGAA